MDALAAQIQDVLCGTANPLIERLQVEPRMVFNPTPPSIDVYPAEVFTETIAFDEREFHFMVRVRVGTAENEGGQDLLLTMMDPRSAESVEGAILSDPTLGSTVDDISLTAQTGFGVFPAVAAGEGSLLGCTWDVTVTP